MVITKSFTNNFRYLIQAKARRFMRRSIFQYFTAVLLFSYGRYLLDTTIKPVDILFEGVLGFISLCVIIMLILVVAAKVQSKKHISLEVTFTENELTITSLGKTNTRSWDWILSAEESLKVIALLIKRKPFFELYLPKSMLNENEYQTFRNWLIIHNKLTKRNKEH